MAENMDTPPSVPEFAAQIAALTAQVQENANKFLALEDENATLRRENRNLSERLSAVETTPHPELRFQVPVIHMQSLETPELGNSSSQPTNGSSVIQGHNQQPTSEGQLLITSSAVDTALLHAKLAGLNALNATSHQVSQPTILATPMVGTEVQAPVYTTMPLATTPIGHSARPHPTVNQPFPTTPAPSQSIVA